MYILLTQWKGDWLWLLAVHGKQPNALDTTVPPVRLSVSPQPPPSSLCFWTIISCLHQVVLAEHQRLHEPFHFRWIENHFKWWKDTLAYLFFLTFVTFFFYKKKKKEYGLHHTLTAVLFCTTRNECERHQRGFTKKKTMREKNFGASQDSFFFLFQSLEYKGK